MSPSLSFYKGRHISYYDGDDDDDWMMVVVLVHAVLILITMSTGSVSC